MTIMREFIIADNQDITKAGMMFLLSRQKDTALLLEADNKAELIQQLRLHPGAVVILDYTSFDFVSSDELIVLHERFKEADWLLFSDELSIGFLRQVLFSSMSFGVVLKDNSKEEIPQLSYHKQPPEEYFQKVGREQRTRSYQIRYESGYCGFSGILYLISPLPMHSLEASSYTTPNCPGAIPCNFSSETIR